MKLVRIFVTVFAAVALSMASALSDVDRWSSNGPFGATVSSLALDPVNRDKVYAGTDGGVFVTRDGGLSWISLPSAPSGVSRLVIDPLSSSNLYAAAASGLFKSVDAGTNWIAVTPTSTSAGPALSVALEPLNPSTVLVGTNDGLYKSTDGGVTWSGRRLAGSIYSLVFSSDTPATAFAADYELELVHYPQFYPRPSRLAKSTDQGTTWLGGLAVDIAIGPGTFTSDPTSPLILYAGNYRYANLYPLHKSVDSGSTWSPVLSTFGMGTVYALVFDPRNPRTHYLGTSDGVFRSTDGGTSWAGFNTGLLNQSVFSLAIDCTGTRLYAGTQGGGVFAYQIGPGGQPVSCAGEGYEYRTTLPPCRLVDTRGPTGSLGGPALQAQGIREFLVGGNCGVPVSAKAIFANLTAVESTVDGSLTAYPADLPAAPLATSVAYTAGKTRAAASTIPLSPTGAMKVRCNQSSSTVHLIVDIQGYFE